MTNPLKSNGGGSSHGQSAYRASEWAYMARAKRDDAKAKLWEEAARNGWDDQHFSLIRREQLADKYPGSFGRNLEYRGDVG